MSHKKTIWFLHPYACAPSIGKRRTTRPYCLVKAMNEDPAYRACVVTASHEHLCGQKTLQTTVFSDQVVDSVPFLFVNTPAYQGNRWGRLRNMFVYVWHLFFHWKKAVALIGTPDIVIASSPHLFHYLAAKRIAKRCGATLIFEVRDLWPLSLIELLGMSRFHPFVLLAAYIEKNAYQCSDYVVSLLPGALQHMRVKGLAEEKYCYVPNGYWFQKETPARPAQSDVPLFEAMKKCKAQGSFIVGYVGSHGVPNALWQLVDAAKQLVNTHPDFLFHIFFVGDGIEKKRLMDRAEGISALRFYSPINQDEVSAFLSFVDVAFLGWCRLSLYRYGVSPNKVFEYMANKKPILEALPPELEDPVVLSGCGLTVEAEAPSALADGILQMAALSAEARAAMGEKGYQYARMHHDYEVLAQRYLSFFGELC